LAEFGLMRVRYVLEDGELAKSHYRKQISFCTCFISQPERGGGRWLRSSQARYRSGDEQNISWSGDEQNITKVIDVSQPGIARHRRRSVSALLTPRLLRLRFRCGARAPASPLARFRVHATKSIPRRRNLSHRRRRILNVIA
jgi:hypothetical protein